MAVGTVLLYALNRGLISVLGLARTDLKRTALSAQTMTNWMPRSLGSMMLRPGLKYVGGVLSNLVSRHIPFVFAVDDTAIIELTNGFMRVLISEVAISRVSVTTSITNGTFNSDLTGWTDADETGAASTWASGGWMALNGTGINRAIRRQTVTVSGGNANKEHALEIHIRWGPVTLKVGTADDDDSYISKTELDAGYHSLAFTPTGSFRIQLSSSKSYPVLVDYITIAAAGDMKVPTQVTTALLPEINWTQSADVIYVAVPGVRQQKIERRGTRSWSMVDYQPVDGPFNLPNTDLGVTITPSATTGQITLTASRPLFSANDANDNGPLWRIVSSGQDVTSVLAGNGQFTDPPVKVTGVTGTGHARRLYITITGTWTGTLQLQRSIAEVGSWANVFPIDWTANVSADTYDDGLDNQIAYYRVIFSAYTSGTAIVTLSFSGGSITGVVRGDVFNNSMSILGEVLKPLGGTGATSIWSRGVWSKRTGAGFPTAVALHEGRLWWAGHDKIIGSVSDGFQSFDDQTVGDSGPIQRSIGSGPVDTINWLISLQSLVAGGEAAEHGAHSTTFDEPLTPTNFQIKETSTQGSSGIPAVKIDLQALFIQRSGRRLFQLSYDIQSNGYTATDLTLIIPEIAGSGAFVSMAVQRQPDTRIHCVRSDGKVAVLVFDPAEELRCWVLVETDGVVEEVFTLPADEEDAVYYVVKRTINSATVRYLERWALESECQGSTLNRQADSFILYSGAAVTTITGLSTLALKSVVVWGDGKYQGTFTVSAGGQITGLPVAVSSAVIGLAYTAQFKSSKLAYAAQLGTALSQRKRLSHVGLIMTNTHPSGISFGPDFTTMDGLPTLDDELAAVDPDAVWDEYDHDLTNWPGGWSVDSRVCLLATAPKPVTVCGISFAVDTEEKT